MANPPTLKLPRSQAKLVTALVLLLLAGVLYVHVTSLSAAVSEYVGTVPPQGKASSFAKNTPTTPAMPAGALTAAPAPVLDGSDGQAPRQINANVNEWNVEYLPAIMNGMVSYYKSTNLQPHSLDMMLPPSEYHALTCKQLRERHLVEYNQVVQRIDFTRPPKYKMPWYYHDPYALCGRYQLTHLHDGHPQYVHRASIAQHARRGETSDAQMQVAQVYAGEWSVGDVAIEHCGLCSTAPGEGLRCKDDVLILARLVGATTVVSAQVVDTAETDRSSATVVVKHALRFLLRDPGDYVLEIKLVHVNGSSNNASLPKSLGVIGIRASDHNRKSFKYNLACDFQRHIYGSPLKVLALARSTAVSVVEKPLCSARTFNQSVDAGHWARIPYGRLCDDYESGRFCRGDPTWMTDACGFNTELVWVPDSCTMRVYTPPKGPEFSCLKRGRSGFLLFVGDSVAREYVQNCRLFDFRAAKLHCLFGNIALEGQHYSLDYAKAVVKAMFDSIKQNRPGILATNLGIHHMIGKSSTAQWIEFVDLFVATWKSETIQILDVGTDKWLLERAVWLGPPTIHYARHGMGHQRGALWDAIAWERLEPLGFIRLYAIAPTLSRTEATWDGLHYASYKGKVQSPWRNRAAPVLLWNGGVSNMLFNILLNLVCQQ